jgi:RNA polymerase sigma factor (sigma-70 family)
MARRNDSPAADAALQALCQTYWYPLYVFIRRRGHPPDEAADLTQTFFERLLEKNFLGHVAPDKGRFRAFLLASLKHFLANEWHRARTQKRGGGMALLSLDDRDPEARYQIEPIDDTTPETVYEQRWALTLLERVLAALRTEFATTERSVLFDHLKIFITTDEPDYSYAEVAERTGLKEGTVKVAVHRLRRRYGELLRTEIANTVEDPGDIEEELRHLIAVLSR